MIVSDEIGNLDGDVRLPRQQPETVAPDAHAVGIPVDGTAAVIEHELQAGKGGGQSSGIRQLPGKHHQIEDQATRSETRQAAAPCRFVHDVGPGGEAAGRVRVPAQNVTDAGDTLKGGLRFDQGMGLGIGERHMYDVARRHPAGFVKAVQPAGFADAVFGEPAGFDMDGGDHTVAAGIAPIIVRKIVPPERSEITEPASIGGRGAQPRMPPEAQVPEVVMGIDDRSCIELWHEREFTTQ